MLNIFVLLYKLHKKFNVLNNTIHSIKCKYNYKKKLMAPFYGWGSTASRLEPLRGSLLFTTKSPEIPGTHFIDLGRMKDWVMTPEHGTNGLGIQRLNH